MNHTRLYVELRNVPRVIAGDRVFIARELKPSVDFNRSTQKRLNPTAWAAMLTRLGL